MLRLPADHEMNAMNGRFSYQAVARPGGARPDVEKVSKISPPTAHHSRAADPPAKISPGIPPFGSDKTGKLPARWGPPVGSSTGRSIKSARSQAPGGHRATGQAGWATMMTGSPLGG